MTVGETPFTHDETTLAGYVLPKNKELNSLFQFEIMDLDSPPEVPLKYREWKLSEMKAIMGKWQNFKRGEGFWNTSVFCASYIANLADMCAYTVFLSRTMTLRARYPGLETTQQMKRELERQKCWRC